MKYWLTTAAIGAAGLATMSNAATVPSYRCTLAVYNDKRPTAAADFDGRALDLTVDAYGNTVRGAITAVDDHLGNRLKVGLSSDSLGTAMDFAFVPAGVPRFEFLANYGESSAYRSLKCERTDAEPAPQASAADYDCDLRSDDNKRSDNDQVTLPGRAKLAVRHDGAIAVEGHVGQWNCDDCVKLRLADNLWTTAETILVLPAGTPSAGLTLNYRGTPYHLECVAR